jgi:uncharacterized protein (TIGR02453 family)
MLFTGFTKTSISFLNDLARNNNKDWFEQNRPVYEKHLLEPLRQLTTELGIVIKSIDAEIDIRPLINRTISKIFRDTRFSMDKSPFRINQWISFKRPAGIWGNVPEFYFYFTPEEYQYGMGFYAATPANMEKFRDAIISFPDRFKKIVDFYQSQNIFTLDGVSYKKHIRNSLPENYQEWFQKKSLYVSRIKKIDNTFFSAGLKNEIENAFKTNAALYHFLMESIIR